MVLRHSLGRPLPGRHPSGSSGLRSWLVVLIATTLALTLAACGSRIDPNTVASVNGQPVAGSGAAAPGADGLADGTLPDDTLADDGALDPGAPGDVGGADPGAGAGAGDSGDAASGGGGGQGSGGSGGGAPAAGGGKAASCDGFKNGPGITDDKITIANVSDISGPVPGLFESTQDAVRAYIAFFNSTSDICGRKLALETYDSRTDAGADQQGYVAACSKAFAAVGSMSAFDSGGAATAQNCGLPDLRSAMVTKVRGDCTTCYSAQGVNARQFENAVPDFILKNYGDAGKNAALLYLNAGAAAENAKTQRDAMTKRGMVFKYFQPIDVAEFNYAPYVQQLKDKGIKYVQFIGAYAQAVRLAQAMAQQSFKPTVYMLDPAAYDKKYVTTGGSAVEGTVLFMNFVPFEEASTNKEMQTYLQWLRQVKPGADPDFFGVFAWSAARLFVERSLALGGQLNRQTLLAEFKKVNNWTANGLHSKQPVGAKTMSECWRFLRLKGGKWVPEGSRQYSCSGVTTVG
ncbi:ABC transporter substrate-binding protein [Nocardioides sp.]|uniref:ABC transporter substrate-binding protein n=1 Tax=Nocardioides sp. TaxID=35761 RepID=UPI00273749B5|nr:ABC transporter substrate-binding protein [Nocardioides sp.]MDP3893175.1 ABC transporter substrate-binding protein [Nocardioides sp.]